MDPDSLELEHRFEELYAACQEDEVLAEAAAGELIDTEIEIRSGRGRDASPRRSRCSGSAGRGCSRSPTGWGSGWPRWAPIRGPTTSTSGSSTRSTTTGCATSSRWVAQRNNTWSLHVHVGFSGADRAIAVCDHLRELLPAAARAVGELTVPRRPGHRPALGPDRDLHPHVPALRRPRAVRRLGDLRGRSSTCSRRPSAIVESTQLWWSVRPHHAFGTVELRICDAQTRRRRVVRPRRPDRRLRRPVGARLRRRAGCGEPLRRREIEENLWRAIRYGMDGEMIDWRAGRRLVPTRAGGRAAGRVDRAGARELVGRRGRAARAERRPARPRRAEGGRPSRTSIARRSRETRRTYAPEPGPGRH